MLDFYKNNKYNVKLASTSTLTYPRNGFRCGCSPLPDNSNHLQGKVLVWNWSHPIENNLVIIAVVVVVVFIHIVIIIIIFSCRHLYRLLPQYLWLKLKIPVIISTPSLQPLIAVKIFNCSWLWLLPSKIIILLPIIIIDKFAKVFFGDISQPCHPCSRQCLLHNLKTIAMASWLFCNLQREHHLILFVQRHQMIAFDSKSSKTWLKHLMYAF